MTLAINNKISPVLTLNSSYLSPSLLLSPPSPHSHSPLPFQLSLIIGVPVTMTITINNNKSPGVPVLDYDMGNGFSRSITGTFGITIGLSASVSLPLSPYSPYLSLYLPLILRSISAQIGCDVLGVDVTATITPLITIGSGDPCFKKFEIQVNIEIEYVNNKRKHMKSGRGNE